MKKIYIPLSILAFLTGASYLTPRTIVNDAYRPVYVGLVYVAVSMVFIFCAFWSNKEKAERKLINVMLIPSGCLGYMLCPPPYNYLALSILIANVYHLVLGRRSSEMSAFYSAAAFLFTSLSVIIYHRYAFMVDGLFTISKASSMLLQLAGYSASAQGNNVYVDLAEKTLAMRTSIVIICPQISLLFMLACFVLYSENGLRKGICFYLVPILYVLVRYFIILSISLRAGAGSFTISEVVELVSMIPLTIFFSQYPFRRIWRTRNSENNPKVKYKEYLYGVAACLLVVGLLYHPLGTEKKGRILIQEYGAVWEPSYVPVNKEIFGVRTMYNYTNMADELARYYDVQRSMVEVSDELLRNVDVLILKCPTKPYSDSELKAIVKFVNRGGGVWLIGDHTDVFGMNLYLNQIGKKYGFKFNGDAVVESSSGRQIYGADQNYGHPIVRRLNEPYLSYTSCSIDLPISANAYMIGNRLFSDKADYSVNTFFGNFQQDYDEYYGPIPQGFTLQPGRGRIVGWADSTAFSSFCIFMPGQMELALDTVTWLNHKDGQVKIDKTCLWIGLGLVVILLIIGRGIVVSNLNYMIIGVSIALALSVLANRRTYDVPREKKQCDAVTYLTQRRSYVLPLVKPNTEPDPDSYLSSFLIIQRIGKRPFVSFDIDDAVKRSTIVMTGIDLKDLPASDSKVLYKYVEDGGNLILLDCFENKDCKLLNELRIELYGSDHVGKKISDAKTGMVLYADSYKIIRSEGNPLLKANGKTVAIEKNVGKGRVFVSSTMTTFSDKSIGLNGSVPNASQYRLMNILWDAIAEGKIATRDKK